MDKQREEDYKQVWYALEWEYKRSQSVVHAFINVAGRYPLSFEHMAVIDFCREHNMGIRQVEKDCVSYLISRAMSQINNALGHLNFAHRLDSENGKRAEEVIGALNTLAGKHPGGIIQDGKASLFDWLDQIYE